MSTVVTRVSPRLDGEAKVRATLRFGFDHAEAGMLHGAVLRSPLAAGRIVGLDTAVAAAMPGVRAVLTAADVPAVNAGVLIADQPALARDVVRYAGEPLAAVAADTPGQAERAARAIEVTIDPLEVVELETALSARVLHDKHPNLAWETVLAAGDAEGALADAAVVVEEVFHAPRQYQAPIEPHCAVAYVENGRVVVHTPTQAPFIVRRRVATLLELRLNDVRVVVTPIGGGFGGKLEPLVEPIAALLARACGRPVRLLASRREDLQAMGPRENAIVRVRLGAGSDGALLGLEADCLLDAGAYAGETPLFASAAPLLLTGTYAIPNVRVTGCAVYTNSPPTASFRGVCGPYLCFALEASLDRVARRLELDRRELRARNVLQAGRRTPFGQTLDDACLDQALELVPWPGEAAPGSSRVRRGVGLAAQTWITNPEPGQVTLKLEEDGSVLLVTGAVEIGTGAVAIAAPLLVAEALGIDPADVRVAGADTDAVAYDGGAQGSRTTFALAHAIEDAAASLREQIDAVAGGRELSLAEVAEAALWTRGPIVATGIHTVTLPAYDPATLTGAIVTSLATPTYHVHQAEVEVDTETGLVRVVGYHVVQDVGRAVDAGAIAGQVQGGVAQGIGYALFEELRLERGIVVETGFEDYRVPTALDVPAVELTRLETGGPKGVAEPPIVPVAAAIANAVSDAIGRPITRLPITPFAVLEALGRR